MGSTYKQIIEFQHRTSNSAADQAIGYALLHEDGDRLNDLATILLDRKSDDAIAYLIQVYHKLSPKFQQSLIERCPGISGSLRLVCRYPDVQARLNVIDIIIASKHPRLAYIPSLMFHDDLPGLRTKAADVFRSMGYALCERLQRDFTVGTSPLGKVSDPVLVENMNHFFQLLASLLERFGSHRRTEVIESAMIFAPWLTDEIWNLFKGEQSRIGKIAIEILSRNSKPEYAGFAFRALTCPVLGKQVAKLISAECNAKFMAKWLSFGWYRFDGTVLKNLTRIKAFHWLSSSNQPLLDLLPDLQIQFLDTLMLTSVPTRRKQSIVELLMLSNHYSVQEHVVSLLIESGWPEVPTFMSRAVSFAKTIDFSPIASKMAEEYLDSNRTEPTKTQELPADNPITQRDIEENNYNYFDQVWEAFDKLEGGSLVRAIDKLKLQNDLFCDRINEKIISSDAFDRMKSIRLIRKAKLAKPFADQIYQLCEDRDALVRSAAISILIELPGQATETRLIKALDDENLRVQANAIEILEALNYSDLPELIERKMRSPNNRIRANAIKASFKSQYSNAIDALSTMLDHPDPAFRQSALWAISQTISFSLFKKIYHLACHDTDAKVKFSAQKTMKEFFDCIKKTQTDGEPEEIGADK